MAVMTELLNILDLGGKKNPPQKNEGRGEMRNAAQHKDVLLILCLTTAAAGMLQLRIKVLIFSYGHIQKHFQNER